MTMMELNSEQFEELVIAGKGYNIILFGTSGCVHCRILHPEVEKLSTYRTDVSFFEIDLDSEAEIGRRYGVNSVPILMAFNDGKMISTFLGPDSIDDIESWISQLPSQV